MNDKSNQSLPYYVEEDTISFADLVLAIARHLKIIIYIPMIFCTLTIIYAFFIVEPIYTSTAKIMSSSTERSNSHALNLAAQFGVNLPTSSSEPKWVYKEIIKSRTLAKVVLKRKFNTVQFGEGVSLLQILTFGLKEPKENLEIIEIKAVDKLLNMINISENIKTSIMTLSVNAKEPRLASEINKTFIEALDAHQRKYNKAQTSDTKQFIERRIIDTEKELISAEENLKVFMNRNRNIDNSPSLQLQKQRLDREVAVLTGVFTTLKQQLETTKIEEVKESDYVIVIDPPETPLLPSSPQKKRMVIFAGIFGMFIGVGITFIREFALRHVKEEKDKLSKAKSLILQNISQIIPSRFS